MLECLILGDSIAVGVHRFRPECATYARSGINSYDWNNRYIVDAVKPARSVIISLGSNDLKNLNTEIELLALRMQIKASRVFWILPANKEEKRNIVVKIAAKYGDTVLPIKQLSTDRVHPTPAGYRELAKAAK